MQHRGVFFHRFLPLTPDPPRRFALSMSEPSSRPCSPPPEDARLVPRLLETDPGSAQTPPATGRSWALATPPPTDRPKPKNATEGLELFDIAPLDESGFASWKAEQDAARRDFEKRWGVPLNKRVRVQLQGEPSEREGLLRLADETRGRPASTGKLKLRLGDHVFAAAQIESLTRV